MALLSDDEITSRAQRAAAARVITAGTKLNRTERDALSAHCLGLSTTPGDLIRTLILRELAHASGMARPDPLLTEVIGLRLLLHNVLKPLAAGQKLSNETFDAIALQVRRTKADAATELLHPEGGR